MSIDRNQNESENICQSCLTNGLPLHRNVHLVTSYMQNADIAHNVLVSRGEVIGENSGVTMTTVRVYIWPRTSVTGE